MTAEFEVVEWTPLSINLPPDMKLVATVRTSDDRTVHIEFGSADDYNAAHLALSDHFGPNFSWDVRTQPVTWVCRGEDGCEVVA